MSPLPGAAAPPLAPLAPLKADGRLVPDPALARRLAAGGLHTVAQALERSTLVRDLAERSNHELVLGEQRLFLKLAKPQGWRGLVENPPAEAAALARLAAAGVPAARVAFAGVDPRRGALTATYDLEPARPLDAWLEAGGLAHPGALALLRAGVAVVARLHEAGYVLRDLYANQLHADAAQGRVSLIDAERLQEHPGGWNRRVAKDLARLAASLPPRLLPPRVCALLFVQYNKMRNLPIQKMFRRFDLEVAPRVRRIRERRPRTPVGAGAGAAGAGG